MHTEEPTKPSKMKPENPENNVEKGSRFGAKQKTQVTSEWTQNGATKYWLELLKLLIPVDKTNWEREVDGICVCYKTDGPTCVQEGSKTAWRESVKVPRWLQDGPKRHQKCPRWLKAIPKLIQLGPSRFQDDPQNWLKTWNRRRVLLAPMYSKTTRGLLPLLKNANTSPRNSFWPLRAHRMSATSRATAVASHLAWASTRSLSREQANC